MSDIKISSRAFTKMIFHAAKYPHCAVNGILLGPKDNKNKLQVSDAIPLFHQCLHVSPMVEIALAQIESMAADDDQQIVGYYTAPENFFDCTVDKAPGSKVAEKIADNFNSACFVVIDNKMLSLNMDRPAIKVWQNIEGRWVHASTQLDQMTNTLEAVSALLKRGAMKDLYDFDNHLDNLENDWTNEHLNRDLKQIMSMY